MTPLHRPAGPASAHYRAWRSSRTRRLALAAGLTVVWLSAAPATAATIGAPSVLHVGQIAQQDVPALPGSERDTLVEPDVAVSPVDADIAVAAAHDGRYPDGGAVGIETSWTHDGGATWHDQPLPGVTSTTGGEAIWERVSDPVVAFGPDGAVYISTLAFNADGSPQALVWSDDGDATWSAPVNVGAPHANTQNSQPMLKADGTIVDSFMDFGPNGSAEGPEAAEARVAASRSAAAPPASAPSRAASPKASAAPAFPVLVTAISTDGGATWSPGGNITRDLGEGPPGFRCCLPSAIADPVTGKLFATWNSVDATKVKLSSSSDGKRWSAPVVVNRPDRSLLGVNADVSAYAGTVSVSFGRTNADPTPGRFGRQFVATSRDGGRRFLAPTALGPQIDYAFAAIARGIFPGDYIGSAMTKGRLYAVWAVSSAPPAAGAGFHQVLFGASLDTNRSPVRSAAAPGERAAVLQP